MYVRSDELIEVAGEIFHFGQPEDRDHRRETAQSLQDRELTQQQFLVPCEPGLSFLQG